MDRLSPAARSRLMARVRSKDTCPERIVRRILHGMGLRFRLHVRALPGSPDLVLPRHRAVVFVHGCFWHRHARCKRTTTPSTRRRFWLEKFAANRERDRRVRRQLRRLGWRVLVVWECWTRDTDQLADRLRRFFAQEGGTAS